MNEYSAVEIVVDGHVLIRMGYNKVDGTMHEVAQVAQVLVDILAGRITHVVDDKHNTVKLEL